MGRAAPTIVQKKRGSGTPWAGWARLGGSRWFVAWLGGSLGSTGVSYCSILSSPRSLDEFQWMIIHSEWRNSILRQTPVLRTTILVDS